ncbi:hypothetical protein Cst_c10610 [Thermoclostridium stercorarium subsp. stercorarium DSM 8532]|uniref:Glycerol kinase n=1 Tax=Thermoclostridium stercorarium (strain ATCC 35414 / DSM 8532 / NCIMB 11754) TaxID=1121335 RepID=L7VN15_THES1|nr:hypothetical protein [Thermoclostridium stercorarium]AGC68059.1 hypothetical protein Cst_c10610 [Thermoclostridium stercorarium subsp. stercorarium DSM 8532]AGI39087.1 hypothetical protein Clst_1014 [Thermoclostridium stercorarium subsp. stercorarium DSM 8532]
MAGLATGFWKDRNELEQKRSVLAEYAPRMQEEERAVYKKNWHEAVRRALSSA